MFKLSRYTIEELYTNCSTNAVVTYYEKASCVTVEK